MTRDRIKSRALLKGMVRPGRREFVEYGEEETPWPSSHDDDFEGSGSVFGEEFGFMMIADDTASSSSSVVGLIAAESPAGSGIPSSDLEMRSGFKPGAKPGVANPWKIKSPRISAT